MVEGIKSGSPGLDRDSRSFRGIGPDRRASGSLTKQRCVTRETWCLQRQSRSLLDLLAKISTAEQGESVGTDRMAHTVHRRTIAECLPKNLLGAEVSTLEIVGEFPQI